MADKPQQRPDWIGHWITAVVTKFRGDAKETGNIMHLWIQSNLDAEFIKYLPGWVGSALKPGAQANNIAMDLAGHDVGLEFRDGDKIVFTVERSHLKAGMTYVRLESGWHCRIQLSVELTERVAKFCTNYLGNACELRLFDLESEQGNLDVQPTPRRSRKAKE